MSNVEILNKEAMRYFESMQQQEQEKFIITRIKRSKAFKQSLNPKQKETLFSFNNRGEYVYPSYTTRASVCAQTPKNTNVFVELQGLLKSVESAFRANTLHFCHYGIIHRYKKQILEIKQRLDSLKHIKIKGLANLQSAILAREEAERQRQKAQRIYQKMLCQYNANVA
ncbi:MAG TPA: hypothetical protein IAA33_05790 [Candidatus Helicobacter avicola]|nr:hypothetical protein [Candidatus Helicobacter avicola]